jgi:hypothetical protein
MYIDERNDVCELAGRNEVLAELVLHHPGDDLVSVMLASLINTLS